MVGSTFALVVCNGPVVAFTFGLFLKPISQEFGWNRGAMSAASAVASLMIAITVPFAGILVDRWGARRILLPAIVLSSISVAAISLTSASLWVFVALYAIAGLVSVGNGPQPYAKTIAAWFDAQRGLALGVAMAGEPPWHYPGSTAQPALHRDLWVAARVCWSWSCFVRRGVSSSCRARSRTQGGLAQHPLPAKDAAALSGLSIREALTGLVSSGCWQRSVPRRDGGERDDCSRCAAADGPRFAADDRRVDAERRRPCKHRRSSAVRLSC